ncbi:Ubiquinone biosynthesis O-methyltransferase [uncultured archaeon]|nr:Ubiquinone biosynthesis O-methyltransferase [uncultured archaeon]
MKEEDIRKRETFDKYLQLVEQDIDTFFVNRSSFEIINCPACKSPEFKEEFEKLGFKYVSCKKCNTLFVNPRPSFEALKRFYVQSPSTQFWVNGFFKPVAEARREKLFKPRADFIREKFGDDPAWLIGDIGAGFGIFLEELRKIWPDSEYVAIEPSLEMAEICRQKSFIVQNLPAEEVSDYRGQFDLLIAFELFEHLFDPGIFLERIGSLLKPGGYLLLTTLNGQGFDIQLLWENSKSISPPHHLNFFNPKSISLLLASCGFIKAEVTTPGKLDWDIVEGMIKSSKMDLGRFWEFVAYSKNEICKSELQEWIGRNDLSSHMRVIAKKND